MVDLGPVPLDEVPREKLGAYFPKRSREAAFEAIEWARGEFRVDREHDWEPTAEPRARRERTRVVKRLRAWVAPLEKWEKGPFLSDEERRLLGMRAEDLLQLRLLVVRGSLMVEMAASELAERSPAPDVARRRLVYRCALLWQRFGGGSLRWTALRPGEEWRFRDFLEQIPELRTGPERLAWELLYLTDLLPESGDVLPRRRS
jgi:hypothetical protein